MGQIPSSCFAKDESMVPSFNGPVSFVLLYEGRIDGPLIRSVGRFPSRMVLSFNGNAFDISTDH